MIDMKSILNINNNNISLGDPIQKSEEDKNKFHEKPKTIIKNNSKKQNTINNKYTNVHDIKNLNSDNSKLNNQKEHNIVKKNDKTQQKITNKTVINSENTKKSIDSRKKTNKTITNIKSNQSTVKNRKEAVKPNNIFLNDAIYILKNNNIPEKMLSKFSKDETINIKRQKEKLYYQALNEAIIQLLSTNTETDYSKKLYLTNYSKHIVTDIRFEFFENAVFDFVKSYIETFKTKFSYNEFTLICNTIVNELKYLNKNSEDYITILTELFNNNTISTEETNKIETPIPSNIIIDVLKKNQLPEDFSLANYSANQKNEFYKNIAYELKKSLDTGDTQNFYIYLINFSDKLLNYIASADSLVIFKYFVEMYKNNKNNKDTIIINTLTTIKNHYVKRLNEKDMIIFNNELDNIVQSLQQPEKQQVKINKQSQSYINEKKYLVSNKILGYTFMITLVINSIVTGGLFVLLS